MVQSTHELGVVCSVTEERTGDELADGWKKKFAGWRQAAVHMDLGPLP